MKPYICLWFARALPVQTQVLDFTESILFPMTRCELKKMSLSVIWKDASKGIKKSICVIMTLPKQNACIRMNLEAL